MTSLFHKIPDLITRILSRPISGPFLMIVVLTMVVMTVVFVVCGDRPFRRVAQYVFEEENPIFQAVFIGLVLGGLAIFHHFCWQRINQADRYAAMAVVSASLLSFLWACLSNPGRITRQTVLAWTALYPFDNQLHVARTTPCKECGFVRPARAKHQYGACIAKFDHYCPWLNNSVGAYNHRFFVTFLLSTAFMCLYCTYLVLVRVMYPLYLAVDFDALDQSRRARARMAGRAILPGRSSTPERFMLIIARNIVPFCLSFFTLIMGVVLVCFAGYHLYMACTNSTTYEGFKWDNYHYAGRRAVRGARVASGIPDDQQTEDDTKVVKAAAAYDPDLPNPYDRGVVANLREFLFPPVLYGGAGAPTTSATSAKGKSKKKTQ
jgi:palmitoyltransferase